MGSIQGPFGVRSGCVQDAFGIRSRSVRGPFVPRSGSTVPVPQVRFPYMVISDMICHAPRSLIEKNISFRFQNSVSKNEMKGYSAKFCADWSLVLSSQQLFKDLVKTTKIRERQ